MLTQRTSVWLWALMLVPVVMLLVRACVPDEGTCGNEPPCETGWYCVEDQCRQNCNAETKCIREDETCINNICMPAVEDCTNQPDDAICVRGTNAKGACMGGTCTECTVKTVQETCSPCHDCINYTCTASNNEEGFLCEGPCSFCDDGTCTYYAVGEQGECSAGQYCCGNSNALSCQGSSATCPANALLYPEPQHLHHKLKPYSDLRFASLFAY